MLFRQLFDPETSTYSYLLADADTGEAVLIDPVREQYDRDATLLDELGLTLRYTLDTHVHADHVTAAGLFRSRRGSRSVGAARGGPACVDVPVGDGDTVSFGRHGLEVRATPGHTDGCITFVLDDHSRAFTGDTLLIRGCGRTDFQQGDAATLYESVHGQIFSLPDACAIYPGHDYQGRTVTTVAEEKRHNPRLGGGKTKEQFIAIMAGLNLAKPKRIDEAVPANLECGLPTEPAVTSPPEATDWAPIARTAAGVPEIDVAWLRDELRASPASSLRVVDVREPDELAGPLGAIEGVENVPLGVLDTRANDWDREAPLVVLCKGGGRSARAARMLENLGFARVASLRGGMRAWRSDATVADSCG